MAQTDTPSHSRKGLATLAPPVVGALLLMFALVGLVGTAIRDPRPHDIPVAGMPECLLNAQSQLKIDEVIVALPEEDPKRLQEIREMLKRLAVKVTFASGWPVLKPLEI